MSDNVSMDVVKEVAKGLKPVLKKLVFVGGAVVELYANQEVFEEVRPTTDVDVVVELTGYGEYAKLEEKLIQYGFQHDSESNVTCRYKFKGITVDIMPTDEAILGFSNKWYTPGMRCTFQVKLEEGLEIRLFEPAYFLASKFEAFKGRGGDRRTSHDFEDIIYFLDNRKNWAKEMTDADENVRKYLSREFKILLNERTATEDIAAHLPFHNRKEKMNSIQTGMQKVIDFSN